MRHNASLKYVRVFFDSLRGYVVSNFATDGFAMLKAEYFYKTKDGKKKRVAAESD